MPPLWAGKESAAQSGGAGTYLDGKIECAGAGTTERKGAKGAMAAKWETGKMALIPLIRHRI
jgi:hypothetical protein